MCLSPATLTSHTSVSGVQLGIILATGVVFKLIRSKSVFDRWHIQDADTREVARI